MSRPTSKSAGGAYPLVPEWRKLVSRLFRPFDTKHGRRGLLLDPFFNEGDTAISIANDLNLEVYGSELQDKFIPKARENLGKFYTDRGMMDYSLSRMLHEDAFKVEASNGAFGFVWINSPFDDVLVTDTERHRDPTNPFRERYELRSVKHFFKYVAPNGYMVATFYAHHMTKAMFRVFRSNCDQIFVFRFPGLHLDHYTQVLVIGQRLKGHIKREDVEYEQKAEKWFTGLGANPDTIAPLDAVCERLDKISAKRGEKVYLGALMPDFNEVIPALNIGSRMVHFKAQDVSASVRVAQCNRYGAHHLPAFAEFGEPASERRPRSPLHEPNKRQMAINIAGGMLDGVELFRNNKRCLMRGKVSENFKSVGTEEEIIHNKDETVKRIKETTIIHPEHQVVLIYEDGVIENVTDIDKLNEIIAENGALLVEKFRERYKPFYTKFIHPTWAKMFNVLRVGGRGKMFKAQQYVVVCTIEHLALRQRQITAAQQGFGKSSVAGAAAIGLRIINVAIKHKKGNKLPKIAEYFGMTEHDLFSLLDSMEERYGVSRKKFSTIGVDEPVVIGAPAIAPNIWTIQELPPLYSGFKCTQLFNTADVDAFMAEAKKNKNDADIYVGVMSYENAKANEGVEPFAHPRYFRSRAWEQGSDGQYKKLISVKKKPSCPVIGEIIKDNNGNEMLWKRFTPEGRGKSLQFYEGIAFWGYDSEVVRLPSGKEERRLNRNRKLYSTIVSRRLTEEEIELNKECGWPKIISRQYPLYGEIRRFGLPKLGNGVAITPMKEVHVEGKTIRVTRYQRDGRPTEPYIDHVFVKPYVLRVPDYSKQVNLTDEEILDPWLASKGVRCIDERGRRDAIDRLMVKHKRSTYTIGDGVEQLDEELKKKGLKSYKLNIGERTIRNPRYPIADYFMRYYSGQVALFIADELHSAKSNTSEVGAAFSKMNRSSKMVNGLTGTVFNGKSSSLYFIAYEFDPEIRKRYAYVHGTSMKWVEDMGVRRMVEVKDVGVSGNSIRSGGKKSRITVTEAPGASPLLSTTIAPYTLWASLLDLHGKMPFKQELTYEVEPTPMMDKQYQVEYDVLRKYNADLLEQGDKSFLATYYVNMLYRMDAMHREWTVIHNKVQDKGAARKKGARAIPEEVLWMPSLGNAIKPKEQEAMDWLKKDLAEGRRVIITLCQTGSRDIQPRWFELIKENVPDANPFILKDSVKPADRSTYIRDMAKRGYNVMITNGGLITTAISLTMFSAMYVIEYEQSLAKFSQYLARINRPNQERSDIVYRYFYYANNFQKAAVMNIADKYKAAAVFAGTESGDMASMMSNDDRVWSPEAFLKAIESGAVKEASAKDIAEAFASQAYGEINWSDSAWYVEGDENEDDTGEYVESEEVIEEITNEVEEELIEESV